MTFTSYDRQRVVPDRPLLAFRVGITGRRKLAWARRRNCAPNSDLALSSWEHVVLRGSALGFGPPGVPARQMIPIWPLLLRTWGRSPMRGCWVRGRKPCMAEQLVA
jgi:hypothetical protein